MIDIINSYIGIASFVLTIVTLIISLRIKSKLNKYSDRQQFLQERHIYLEELTSYYDKINTESISYDGILEILRNIQKLLEEMLLYKIWQPECLTVLSDFKVFTEKCSTEIDSYSKIETVFSSAPFCHEKLEYENSEEMKDGKNEHCMDIVELSQKPERLPLCKELRHPKRCPYCAMSLRSGQKCVCGKFTNTDIPQLKVEETIITHTFKNEFCAQLGKIIALLKRPSSIK